MLVALAVGLGGCGRPDDAPAGPPALGEVIVLTTLQDTDRLDELLSAWTDVSGVRVSLRSGHDEELLAQLVDNSVNPPADLFWAVDITGTWRAAEEGALRPAAAPPVAPGIAASLRDADGYWVATTYARAVIVYDRGVIDLPAPQDYANLADARYAGRLCLSRSRDPVNRAVLARLIEDAGIRNAELAVRAWMANLSMPIVGSGAAVIEAITAGGCELGIVSSAVAAAKQADNERLAVLEPANAPVLADGIGIGRHARRPDVALALLEWLTSPAILATLAADTHAAPAAAGNDATGETPMRRDVLLAAMHFDEARLLAERAGWN